MLRKWIALAITSGLAAKLYRRYMNQRGGHVAPAAPPATRRRRAGTKTHQI